MKNRDSLQKQYLDYFELITGRCEIEKSPLISMVRLENRNALFVYQSDYLKAQILNWSGVIEEIFSETCKVLKEEKIDLDAFVSFFYQTPLPPQTEYDFFKIKLDRFKEFVIEAGKKFEPSIKEKLLATAEQEYKSCWEAYLSFNPPD